MNEFEGNKTVSIIIPVYNSSEYLRETIQSAINQTYNNLEIILVDDYSDDNSVEIISDYIKQYDFIVLLKQYSNQGVAVARNKALDLAKGRYVAFLDSDDIWYPSKTIKQLSLLKDKNASISFTGLEIIDRNGINIKNKIKVKDKINYNFLLKNTMIATSSVIIDRYKTGRFHMPLLRSGQDYATWLFLLRNDTYAYGINEVLIKYRRSNNSLSANKIKSVKQVWSIQTSIEGVNPLIATYNTLWYILNALRKY